MIIFYFRTARRIRSAAILVGGLAITSVLPAASLAIFSAADATLYEDATGSVANGAGEFLFAGRTNLATNPNRRSLLQFDFTGLPAGSVITSASLRLHMVGVITSDTLVNLHRVTTGWTAGPSDPISNEAAGVPASAGDVTWLHASFSNILWSTPGGDAAPVPSASVLIGAVSDYYTWNGPGVLSDVQNWAANPATNFGWMLRTDETVAQTAKRFESGNSLDSALRPLLTVEYDFVPEPAAFTLLGGFALAASRRRARPHLFA